MRRMTAFFVLAAALAVGTALWLFWPEISAWSRGVQRELQTLLARGVRAAQVGEPGAVAAVLGICFAYGVAHAVGPGHGKALIAGAAMASRRTALRMAGVGMTGSLVQGLFAIVLVYGGLGILSFGRGEINVISEYWLAPASFAVIAAIGLWIAWRGARSLHAASKDGDSRARAQIHLHGDGHGSDRHHAHGHCGHHACGHVPDPRAVAAAEGWRGAFALVIGVALRPCSGALIVLAIAWTLGLAALGAAAAMAMALGTGAIVASVGLFAARIRDAGLAAGGERAAVAVSLAHLAIGTTLAAVAFGLMVDALNAPAAAGGALGV